KGARKAAMGSMPPPCRSGQHFTLHVAHGSLGLQFSAHRRNRLGSFPITSTRILLSRAPGSPTPLETEPSWAIVSRDEPAVESSLPENRLEASPIARFLDFPPGGSGALNCSR